MITLALLGIFFYTGVMESAFHRLDLSADELGYAMALSILLSLINIQLFSLRPGASGPRGAGEIKSPLRVPVGINLGGCVTPLFFCFYLLHRYPFEPLPLVALVLAVATIVYPLSRVEKGQGLVVHLAGAILGASLGASLLEGEGYLVGAYCAAVLGTLIGGDLAHLAQLRHLRLAARRGIFIGGAGLMDAIFLSGLFALFAAEALHGGVINGGVAGATEVTALHGFALGSVTG
ncbi:DUF1614 domain-containing protein [Motiliproteus sp. SC1-56]|uniref:DUF1614 domain-containing protein n=1 Tax=Motiliproteus sp. SC1-56 TaxID=2799565 RepID=UPI00351C96E4